MKLLGVAKSRKGTILPMTVLATLAIFGFVALSIDVGMIAVARAEAQNAADAAATTGARSLDGSASSNLTQATTNAQTAATSNTVLGTAVQSASVTVQHGAYHYDAANQKFIPQIPPVAPDNYNLTRVDVTNQSTTAFARVFNVSMFNVTATAIAAHRPRDINIILDFSGSMNNESDLWNNETYLGSVSNSPNNTDPIYPLFGHYSAGNTTAQMQCTSSDPRVGKCNITQTVLGMPALVDDFYQHARGATAAKAFTAASNGYKDTPGGDNYMAKFGTGGSPPSTYAKTVQEITNGATFNGYCAPSDTPSTPFTGYTGTSLPTYKNYTQGPKYYGKTFFMWPPDPRAGKDWRGKFFLKTGGSYPTFGGAVDDNTKLWDSSGIWRTPSGNYVINYAAILQWIKATPTIFPTTLRAGRILYYDAIPDDVPSQAYDHTINNYSVTWANQNQRFWKEYIDYTLGVWRDPSGAVQTPGNPSCSYGPDFTWGTIKVSAKPTTGTPVPYMDYNDNPKRPRHRFWFGPMTMVQFVSDCGLLPGTAHDISMYPAKLGIAGALEDIRNNHPNDLVSLILFNRPHFNGEAAERGRFSSAQFSLSRDYTGMQNALWFPPNSGTADVRPWDANGIQSPRAGADYQSNTCSNYGFMIAYNQLSENASLQTGGLGGNGRRGAQRLIVFETDGMANVAAIAGFVAAGKDSYYQIGPSDSVTSGGTASTGVYNVVDRICALETDTSTGPGFARPGRPVIVHCVAFGAVFEPTASGTEADSARTLLQTISTKGNTTFPDSSSDPTNGFKWCIGTLDERKDKLQTAFRRITDANVSPALIK